MGSNQPLIFVPGLLGTIGDEIIPGTGELGFGPAGIVYNEFEDKLESIGYKKGKDLFNCFYNWKKPCAYNAQKYLSQEIEKAKHVSGCSKVNIIAHSMGGLISQSYVCSTYYRNDVSKLIMIGCPNAGSTDAYYVWADGKIPERIGMRPFLFNVLLEGFLIMHILINKNKSVKELVHEEFESIKELLPSLHFGKYTYYLDKDQIMKYIEYKNLMYQNTFLDQLNRNKDIYDKKRIKTFLIYGSGKATGKYIQLNDVVLDETGRVVDSGRVVGKVNSYEGDGTVLQKSAEEMMGIRYCIHNASHTGLMMNGLPIIEKILSERAVPHFVKAEIRSKEYLGIIVLGNGKIHIETNHRSFTMKKQFQMKDFYYLDIGKLKWIIMEEKAKKPSIVYSSDDNEKIHIVISQRNKMEHKIINASKATNIKIC